MDGQLREQHRACGTICSLDGCALDANAVVYCRQPKLPGIYLTHNATTRRKSLHLDLATISAGAVRLPLIIDIAPGYPAFCFDDICNAIVQIIDDANNHELAAFTITAGEFGSGRNAACTAMAIGELAFDTTVAAWYFYAIGLGYPGGIREVLRQYNLPF